jgi:hypothetical protein
MLEGRRRSDDRCSEVTHGGFDGPYGIKIQVKARRAKEGRGETALGRGALRQPGEEGRETRRRQTSRSAGRQAQDDGQEGTAGTQKDGRTGGAQATVDGAGAGHGPDGATALATAHAAKATELAHKPATASGLSADAAPAGDTPSWRSQFGNGSIEHSQAVGELVIADTA